MSKTGNIEAIYPLSPMQEGILFHTLYTPQTMGYFEQSSSTLEGDLNVAAFERAWQTIVARHPILRTLFTWEKRNQPLQIVRQKVRIPFAYQDWRAYSPSEQQAQLEAFLISDRKQGFDLSKAPLMRLALMRLSERQYQFTWSFHHLLLDGWSGPIVLSEMFTLYEGYRRAERPVLPHRRPYRDYIGWLQQQDLTQTEPFWRAYLDGFTNPTPFGVDTPKSNGQKEAYAKQEFILPQVATEPLQQLVQQNRLTMSTLIQGVWATILSRYSDERDVVFGATVSGRAAPLEDIENMVGLFINTLPLRVQVTPEVSFVKWLQALQAQHTEMRLYEHSPLTHIQQCSNLPARLPLFESILVLENYPIPQQTETLQRSLRIRKVRVFEQTNYPLTVQVMPSAQLTWQLHYDCNRFADATITRMLWHIQTLLESIVADPNRPLGELSWLTETERQQLLVDWNDTWVDFPKDRCIHELFEAQVERTPDDIAVIFGKQRLTYRELNTRANQLAHYLRLQGVVAESLVGIWMDRSPNMMVALLGTLKAGGAYVPLDPSYPQKRLAFMLEDAQALVLLTREKFLEDLPAYAGHVVCLDKDFEAIAGGSEENPISGITADSAAYVIYTSGSTGTPKGVIGLHRGAVNRLSWMWRVYPFKDGEVCCQKTYLSFVDSVWEIFGPLLQGVPAVIIPEEVVKDPHLLVDNLAAARVSRIVLVPSLLGVLLDSFDDLQKRLFDLKIWISSGEEISVELAQRFRQVMPGAKLINLYGSSEVSADVTCDEVAAGMPDRSVPIGRPIDNASIYILDSHLQPVPIGVPGELYIGGVGLARGYLNQPDLTAERFIPSPFGQEEVFFKTGDLGRYLLEGNIEYLGRRDHQVKVRGFRIELGEIESQIKGLEAVSNCVVVLREDRPADQRLAAYYVCKDAQAVSESEMRRQLQAKLPEYMLPQHFVKLSSIPLTPSGKVNRKALPKPETDSSLEQGYVAPRTEAEQKIAAVWQEVLNRERVGVNDDFFELGGHSLLATQVMSRINKLFNIQLPLRRFFEAKTIETLAEVIDISLWNAQDLQRPGITGNEEREVIEL